MDNDHKQQEKQAILTELESIKELLHEDGQFSADDLQELDIPVLQEVFSTDDNTNSQASPTLPAAPTPETDVDNDDDADQLSSAYTAFTAVDNTSPSLAGSENERAESNEDGNEAIDEENNEENHAAREIQQQDIQQTVGEQSRSQDTDADVSAAEHESAPPAASAGIPETHAEASSSNTPTPSSGAQERKKAQQSLFDEEPVASATQLDKTSDTTAAGRASSSDTPSSATKEQAVTNTPLSNPPQSVLKPTAKQRAQTAKPTGENPFLPKHIRDRIQANQLEKANLVKSFSENNQPQCHDTSQADNTAARQEAASPNRSPEPEAKTPARASTTNVARSDGTTNTMDDATLRDIIDAIVAAQLPTLEKQLKAALLQRLAEQPLANTQGNSDDSIPS